MTPRYPIKSAFECAHQNLRSILRCLRYELLMPQESIRLQVEGILRSFEVEDIQRPRPEPERPA